MIRPLAALMALAFLLFIGGCASGPEKAKQQLKNKKISYNADAFVKSAEDGDMATVKLFLEGGMNPGVKGENGRTPLHAAANFNHREIAELLITRGAEIDPRNDKGVTPLFLATYNDNRDVVEMLISKGADINFKAGDGATPLSLAIDKGDWILTELFINKGADINVKKEDGSTALHQLCLTPKAPLDTVKLMISKGAAADAKNNAGLTPLDMAKKAKSKDIEEYLKNLGTKPGGK